MAGRKTAFLQRSMLGCTHLEASSMYAYHGLLDIYVVYWKLSLSVDDQADCSASRYDADA